MKIKLYDKGGEIKKEVDFRLDMSATDVSKDLVAQYVRVYLANQRQGTSKVKGRGEVRGGGKKPWKQKGTGRARVGSIRSPIWVGGGVVHGPTPKDWCLKLNRKMNRLAFRSAFALKNAKNDIGVFEYGLSKNDRCSTKDAAKFLNAVGFKKSVLVIHRKNDKVYRSFRNIPFVNVGDVNNVCAYDVLYADRVLVEKGALSLLQERLAKK